MDTKELEVELIESHINWNRFASIKDDLSTLLEMGMHQECWELISHELAIQQKDMDL